MDYKFKNLIPNGITSIRIILLPIILYAYFSDYKFIAISIFIVAVLTDVIDGYFARKLDSNTFLGVYFDVTADFILVLTLFSAFIIKGIYPSWILLLIILMFLQFILTSKINITSYDPVGKQYGSFLFIIIFITLTVSNTIVYSLLLYLIIILTIISILSRLIFFFNSHKNRFS